MNNDHVAHPATYFSKVSALHVPTRAGDAGGGLGQISMSDSIFSAVCLHFALGFFFILFLDLILIFLL